MTRAENLSIAEFLAALAQVGRDLRDIAKALNAPHPDIEDDGFLTIYPPFHDQGDTQ